MKTGVSLGSRITKSQTLTSSHTLSQRFSSRVVLRALSHLKETMSADMFSFLFVPTEWDIYWVEAPNAPQLIGQSPVTIIQAQILKCSSCISPSPKLSYA